MRRLMALASLALLAACDRGAPPPGVPTDTGLILARSSRAKDSLIVLKDSLLAERARQLSLQSQIIGDATAECAPRGGDRARPLARSLAACPG